MGHRCGLVQDAFSALLANHDQEKDVSRKTTEVS